MELYCKIPYAERLPEKDGLYITDRGTAYFYTKTGHFNIWEYPFYWLEKVTIPTDEEIEKIIDERFGTEHTEADNDILAGYFGGFKSALELLTK